jgi:hypothetical protein
VKGDLKGMDNKDTAAVDVTVSGQQEGNSSWGPAVHGVSLRAVWLAIQSPSTSCFAARSMAFNDIIYFY